MNNVTYTTIDLLRHGHCQGGEIFRGSTDVELSEQGWQQMQQQLSNEHGWESIVSSPLKRCRLFAENFSQQQSLPLSVVDDFQEIYFGDWEGLPQQKIIDEQYELLSQYWLDPMSYTPPNGETMQAFSQRVETAMATLIEQTIGQHQLIIAHGAVIRVMFKYLLGMPFSSFSLIDVPYAAMSRFKIYYQPKREPWVQLNMHRGTPES